MEEEPDPYSDAPGSDERSDAFDDFVKVPENFKVPESSSSPEIIGTEDDQEEEEEAPIPEKESEELRNLERVRVKY